ncbi:MAG: hypothetical protein MZV64_13220 [Ignavibacteriales bacterium]|nr:hypothetical protein [Ignavibacteriales bacterium]
MATTKSEKDEAEESVEELAGLAVAAGAEVAGRIFQVRPRLNPRWLVGEGKVEEIAAYRPRDPGPTWSSSTATSTPPSNRTSRRRSRSRSSTGPSSSSTSSPSGPGRTRASSRSSWPSSSYQLPRLRGQGAQPDAAGRRHRHPRPGRDEARGRPAAHHRPHHPAQAGHRRRSASAARASARAGARARAHGLARRLHQRRQVHSFQPLDRREALHLGRTSSPPSTRSCRASRFPDGRVLLPDRHGRLHPELPVELVTSFRATLEEVGEADCICHVADVASPAAEHQLGAVEGILADLGVTDVPVIKILNKIDLLPEDERALILRRNAEPGDPDDRHLGPDGRGRPGPPAPAPRGPVRRLQALLHPRPPGNARDHRLPAAPLARSQAAGEREPRRVQGHGRAGRDRQFPALPRARRCVMVKRIAVVGLALLAAWSCATVPDRSARLLRRGPAGGCGHAPEARRPHRGRGRLGRAQGQGDTIRPAST